MKLDFTNFTYELDFKTNSRTFQKDKRIKTTILNVYINSSKNKASKYIKQKLTAIKGYFYTFLKHTYSHTHTHIDTHTKKKYELVRIFKSTKLIQLHLYTTSKQEQNTYCFKY